GPQPIDHEGPAVGILQLVQERAVVVEHVDAAVTEVADENLAAPRSEREGRPGDSPGRVQPSTRVEAAQQVTAGVEQVDKPMTRASHIVVPRAVLLRVSDKEIAIHVDD